MWKLISLSIVLTACNFPRPPDNSPDIDGGSPTDGTQPNDSSGSDSGVADAPGGNPGVDAAACMQTTCTAGTLTVCASGTVDHTEPCALGCFSDQTRCNALAPSNGLAASLDEAPQHPAITLPAGSVVNTDTGAVTSAGTPVAVASVTVAQPGGPTLRVLIAKAWTINDVRIQGSLPVAFVASDEIKVQGVIDASADGGTKGPGAQTCGAASGGGGPAQGFFERPRVGNSGGYPDFLWASNGFGGGGFGTAGGAGGITNAGLTVGTPGQPNGTAELVPLRGGCEGGNDATNAPPSGAGGGAIQLVSSHSIHVLAGGASNGTVHVGGGHGIAGVLGRAENTTTPVWGPGGGGSGGGILLEAATVTLDDAAALLAAGGGGGGYGACSPVPDGGDAPANTSTPAGGACPPTVKPAAAGGDGATGGTGAVGLAETFGGSSGSGGGGLGRIRVNTASGQFMAGAAVLRGITTSGTVGVR